MSESPSLYPLVCLICGKPLEAIKGGAGTQPMGGLLFTSGGGYGSRIFDPFASTERIHAAICDECVAERVKRLYAVKEIRTRTTFEARRFESFDEFKDEVDADA